MGPHTHTPTHKKNKRCRPVCILQCGVAGKVFNLPTDETRQVLPHGLGLVWEKQNVVRGEDEHGNQVLTGTHNVLLEPSCQETAASSIRRLVSFCRAHSLTQLCPCDWRMASATTFWTVDQTTHTLHSLTSLCLTVMYTLCNYTLCDFLFTVFLPSPCSTYPAIPSPSHDQSLPVMLTDSYNHQ